MCPTDAGRCMLDAENFKPKYKISKYLIYLLITRKQWLRSFTGLITLLLIIKLMSEDKYREDRVSNICGSRKFCQRGSNFDNVIFSWYYHGQYERLLETLRIRTGPNLLKIVCKLLWKYQWVMRRCMILWWRWEKHHKSWCPAKGTSWNVRPLMSSMSALYVAKTLA